MIVVDESEPVGEIEPPFESRDVQIKRGLNVRDFYDMEEEIGRGKFGTVYKCREKATGLRLAAKFVQAPKKADRINVEREVEIMKSLRNPRLIQLYDAYDDGKKEICLLLELIEGGELFERVIDDDFVLTERACAIFMRQICEGIQFIHLQHVLHLDMKPENILCLTRTGNRIKLIDFGLARRYDPSKKLQVLFGTPEFVAPEVVNFEQIGYGTDLWSVGIIGYVLLSGLSPFMGETDVETMANVTIAKYDFDDEAFNDVSAEAKDFIAKLLVKQISKRMTATESLRHPWLRPRPPLPTPPPPPPAPAEKELDSSSSCSSSPTPTPTPLSENLPPAMTNNEEVKPTAPVENPSSAPPPPTTTAGPDILQLTKVNLRQFVERWSSHPNSPFQLNDGTCVSPGRSISLLIAGQPQVEAPSSSSPTPGSRTSMTGMSPSPPSSLPMSPTLKAHPLVVERDGDAAPTLDDSAVKKEEPAAIITRNVESAIEQTSALLKSVQETLIRQIESGTAVRDRTGARVWERKGSGLVFSSPGGPNVAAGISQKRNPFTPAPSIDQSTTITSTTTEQTDWEVHQPVTAKVFGNFSSTRRHKFNMTTSSTTTTTEESSKTRIISSSSTVIKTETINKQNTNRP